jgi:beta-mannosidase
MESILAMMPKADAAYFPNDDWAEHNLARGENNGDSYPSTILTRYTGATDFSLPEFVLDAQMANYEAYRALYEGRLARMFNGSTAALTWMSNPAQPSTTWQIYSYDLEPFASYFAVRKACEPVHIMMNQSNTDVPGGRGGFGGDDGGRSHANTANCRMMVINNTTTAVTGGTVRVRVVNLDGSVQLDHTSTVTAGRTAATSLGPIPFDTLPELSPVCFVKL